MASIVDHPTAIPVPTRLAILGGTDREFADMLDALRRELAPSGLIEALLVDRIVLGVCRVRQAIQVGADVIAELLDAAERSLDRALTEFEARRSRTSTGWGKPAEVSTRVGEVAHLAPLPMPAAVEPIAEDQADDEPAATAEHWRTRLAFDPNVSDHSPVLRGTWITAGQVVSLIVDGLSWDELLRNYPELTERDIRACLAYTVEQDGPVKL